MRLYETMYKNDVTYPRVQLLRTMRFEKKGPRVESKSRDLTAANQNPPTPYIPLTFCGNFFMCYFRFKIISYSQNGL